MPIKSKNIDNALKERIANLTFLDDGTIHTIEIEKEIPDIDDNGKKQILQIKQKLILSYSTKRAKKDKRTREKALEKIKAKLSKKNITKSDLKLSYYAKYLDIDEKCSIKYKLNPSKVLAHSDTNQLLIIPYSNLTIEKSILMLR